MTQNFDKYAVNRTQKIKFKILIFCIKLFRASFLKTLIAYFLILKIISTQNSQKF